MTSSSLRPLVNCWLAQDLLPDCEALLKLASLTACGYEPGLAPACRQYAWRVSNAAYTVTEEEIRRLHALGLSGAEFLDLTLGSALFSALAIAEPLVAALAPISSSGESDGRAAPVTYGGTLLKSDGTMTGRRLAALIGLRDLTRRVLASKNEGWPEEHRGAARRELNRAHDLFARRYGPINKTTFLETADGSMIRGMPNLARFRENPDAMLVMWLEDYDEITGKAARAAIMARDVVGPAPEVTKVASAEEGL